MKSNTARRCVAMCCAALLVTGDAALLAQETPKPAAPPATAPAAAAPAPEKAAVVPPDQLDALVAPIALYPDPLLAQTLVASTYPLEIVQLQQWLAKHKDLKDKALADAVAKEPWDPSIQSMAAVPEVVKRLADDIQWTTDLGNAFLGQQADVMAAVQRMRVKAKNNGALESNEQQKVEAQVDGGKTVIVVQPTNPEVIYVPSYSPTVVYGPPVYPYPPIYYPPYPPGAAFVSFSFGVMMGAAFWGGSCCGCGWGSSNVNVNVNNNFNKINHYSGSGGGRNNNWNHNPQHRGAAPYADRGTANKYGGSARGDAPGSRGPSASQQPSRGGGSPGASQQPSRPGGSTGSRGGSPSAGTRPSGGGGGSDRIGNRSVPSSSSRASGFGGGSGGYSGSSARASSSRGSRSMGGRPGGGGGGARRR